MLRTVSPERTLWESVLPEACLRMPSELEAVDRLHDPDARPIAKGRLGKPVEFGYVRLKAQVLDYADGVVTTG